MANLDAVKRAVQEVVAAVKEADGAELSGRRKPPPPPGGEDAEGLPSREADLCASGECDHPECHTEEMYAEEG